MKTEVLEYGIPAGLLDARSKFLGKKKQKPKQLHLHVSEINKDKIFKRCCLQHIKKIKYLGINQMKAMDGLNKESCKIVKEY